MSLVRRFQSWLTSLPQITNDRGVFLKNPMRQLKGHSGWVNAVVFSPRGEFFFSAGGSLYSRASRLSGEIYQWDSATGQLQGLLRSPTTRFTSVAVNSSGTLLAGGCGLFPRFTGQTIEPGEIALCTLSPIEVVSVLRGHRHLVSCVAFTFDGKSLASVSYDGTVKLWGVDSRDEKATLRGPWDVGISLAVSPDARTLAAGGGKDIAGFGGCSFRAGEVGAIQLWDVTTQQELDTFWGHTGAVHTLAFVHEAGKILASGGLDGVVRLWDIVRGVSLPPLPQVKSGGIWSLAFAPDDQILAVGSTRDVKLWNWREGREIATLLMRKGRISCLGFSPDGTMLVTGDAATDRQGTVTVWDVSDLTC